ncbi:MAG: hypothetical protein OEY67_11230 [Gammaproteobacteria bacterium]|nr:hypothetical protein [Gammaproteobacteria bacterium]
MNELAQYVLHMIASLDGGTWIQGAISVVAGFTDELGVESDRSRQFGVGIFYFLVIGIIVFSIISFAFMFKDKTKKIKKGELILFIWIMFGVVVAIIFGASQLLQGYLF